MAKIKLTIEDVENGGVLINLEADSDLPANTRDWTSAMRAGMHAYHMLGVPGVDLSCSDVEGEG